MRVALTGATGFIGSHVLTELHEHGHEVTALVRDDAQAGRVAARGATPAVVDLYDRPAVANLFSDADAAIHTASPGDATSADLDSAVADAAIEAFAGTGKPYLQISGLWIYGANSVDHRGVAVRCARAGGMEGADRAPGARREGMRGVVIVSGVAYGDGGGGVPGLLLGSPRDDAGNLIMLGTGQQHWSTVHVADLADFFRRVLEARLGAWPLRHRRRIEPDRRRAHRGGRGRGRRAGSGPRLRRRGARTPGRLLRRGPAARPGHRRGQGSSRARLASVPSGARRRVPPRELPPGDGRLTGPRRRPPPGAGAHPT